MTSLQRTRYTALPLLLCVVMASCSVPDGPDPEATVSSGEPEAVEAAAELITLNGPGQLLPVTAMAEVKGEAFELEVASTPAEQALGLMFRSELPGNRGMLFPFDPPRRTSFWMKDVPVPLDMVFIRNGEVVAIASQVPPCPTEPCPSYGPGNQIVDAVLELRGDRAAELGLRPGDVITFSEL
ncbi:MAG: DUF192 domain-containing protein [Phormidesmis sp.]